MLALGRRIRGAKAMKSRLAPLLFVMVVVEAAARARTGSTGRSLPRTSRVSGPERWDRASPACSSTCDRKAQRSRER